MNKVTLVENPLDASTWVEHDVDDVYLFLVDHFKIWPKNAHIYLNHIAKNSDITPYDAFGAERITKIKGHFYIVVYPDGIETILLVVALAVAAVAVGLSFLLRPSVNIKNQQEQSANNQLSDRQNQARPNQRIPDIYGQLWATFDLLALPYRTFISNEEIEHCYMCIGRGSYTIDPNNIRDDVTPLANIDGASARIFGPNTSPNSGAPLFTIGSAFAESVYNIQKFGAVNGQVVKAPNLNSFLGNNNVRFATPNKIGLNVGAPDPSHGLDFTLYFSPGDSLTIGMGVTNDDLAVDAGGQPSVHLNGTYIISSVTFNEIDLVSPASINANWSSLAAFTAGGSTYRSINLTVTAGFQAGPFLVLNPQVTEFWCNFVAVNGSYKVDSNGNQISVSSTIQVSTQQCDGSGTPIGGLTNYNVTIVGSRNDRSLKGSTLKIVLPLGYSGLGGIIVIAKRTSNTDLTAGVSVSDQVQWRDAYLINSVGPLTFGNITSIQTLIRPTPSALAVKERKQNALVTRNVPTYTGGTTFGALAPSTNAADIICAMAFDAFIGRRTVSEVDIVGIYAIAGPGGTIQKYFAAFPDVSLPTQFCFTFDDSKVSFEESIQDVATAIFCQAFRRGSKLELSFEQQTAQSVLLFNHRNKIPRSETRTMSFGMLNDNDGITLTYVEPNAPNYPNVDTQVTLYFPTDQSAKNPKKIDTIGIRNLQQAKLLGWRLYKKLLYQNLIVQFDATEETAILVLQDRVLVADNTRSDTQDGEVLSVLVLELTLSQAVVFDARFNYTIFLQLSDGSIDSIPITAGSSPNKVILGHAPLLALVTDVDKFARTTYMVVNDGPTRQTACLLSEKNPKDRNIYEVKAVNYDDEYYTHDNDYKSNVDVAQQTLEVVTIPTPPNADVAQLIIEIVTH